MYSVYLRHPETITVYHCIYYQIITEVEVLCQCNNVISTLSFNAFMF